MRLGALGLTIGILAAGRGWCGPSAAPIVPKIPLHVEQNLGPALGPVDGAPVAYVARGGDYLIALTTSSLQLRSKNGANLTATFSGSHANSLVPQEPLPLRINSYSGRDSSRYVEAAPTWSKLVYRDLYPGIDLVLRPQGEGRTQDWEYDFIVAPHADPSQIEMNVKGAKNLRLDPNGDFVAEAADGSVMRWRRPLSFQKGADSKQDVASRFVLHGDTVRIALGRFDRGRALIIDPTLVYSVFFGGSSRDQARGIGLDAAGNVYVAGGTTSGDLPTSKSSYQPAYAGTSLDDLGDAFVAKFNSAGVPTYVTYLGGSGDDAATSLAVDPAGNVYVVGETTSQNFPKLNAAQPAYGGSGGNNFFNGGDAFAAKLNASGGLVYSTYLGGAMDDGATAIAVDSTGAAYIVGATLSRSFFPSAPGYQKQFGGTAGQFINPNGYVTFNLGDAFIVKLDPTGSQVLGATYLGGSLDESAAAVTLDSSNNVWVSGCTNSSNFPTQHPYQGAFAGMSPGTLQPFMNCGDGFLSELSPDLKTLLYSTYFGGNGDDAISAIQVDAAGTVYMTGITVSTNFPTKSPISGQSTYHGPTTRAESAIGVSGDAFVAHLNPSTNQLIFSTYLGGSSNDVGSAIALDSTGAVYVAGMTNSTDFPLQGALQSKMAGSGGTNFVGGDAFVAKLDPTGAQLLFSTYLGGAGADGAMGLLVDPAGNVVVMGSTGSSDFPVVATSQTASKPTFSGGSADAFIAKISGLNSGPGIGGIANVASYAANAVAPGEVVTIFGTGIGPTNLVTAQLDPTTGLVANKLANTQVLFDGVPAPLVFVSATQSCAVVPYGVAGHATTKVQVVYNQVTSAALTMPVVAAVPGLFSANSSGSGAGAIYNQDGTLNSVSNPAAENSTVILFGTGQGALSPALPDGTLVTTTLPTPTQNVGVTFDGIPAASIAYQGPIPQLVVGFWQLNVVLPPSLGSGTHAVIVTVGSAQSQANLTVAVK